MGWNDWAHYQCNFTSQTILDNARALVRAGLAKRGYNTVTIDDCWMQKSRDSQGNLQVDPQRFPHGMKPVADAVHKLGLKFGIYEDAGYATCGGFAGSGEPNGGGPDHFAQDAKLFASWGVDYVKLDGCNVYVPKGGSNEAAYRKAYAAESTTLKATDRPIVFSESAPAYFQDSPEWYDVLTWVRDYGQLWREGTDIATFDPKNPDAPRFESVLWNYSYNLPLGRFQKPGNWDDADFIIGGDSGLSLAETRSQFALWAMMSAPLILSSDLDKLSPQALSILKNKAVIAIDQDPLGQMATLVERTPYTDVLFKRLRGGDQAAAVLNRSNVSVHFDLRLKALDSADGPGCRASMRNLWNGERKSNVTSWQVVIAPHDTEIWRIHPARSCGTPTRNGAITMIVPGEHPGMKNYTRCLSAAGKVEDCVGAPAEAWIFSSTGTLDSGGNCLNVKNGRLAMQPCNNSNDQGWTYNLVGNLIDGFDGKCLTAIGPDTKPQGLALQSCGHNLPNQIWSLPN